MPSIAASSPAGDIDAAAPPRRLGVVVVSWNVRELLLRCLASVRADGPGGGARVVVVDNASSDGTVEAVRAVFPDVTLVANADNRGFTRANNQALAVLGVWGAAGDAPAAPGATPRAEPPIVASARPEPPPDAVLLLNPDTEVRPGAIAALLDHLGANPRCGCVGPLLVNPDGSVQSSRRRLPTLATGLFESTPVEWHLPGNRCARAYRMDDVPPDRAGAVDAVTGSAMLLRTAALREVGGFDEGFFMYAEELDLCKRLGEAGWDVRFEPRAVVVHHEGRSSDQAVAARHARFMRSRIRYFRKHHGVAAAAIVALGIAVGYKVEIAIELGKWLAGRRRPLRRARVAAYLGVLRAIAGADPAPGVAPGRASGRDPAG